MNLNAVIPGHAVAGTEETYFTNWSYTFTNLGHFCLLARVANNSPPGGACAQQGYNSASPATDPQSAIHNINVVSMLGGRSRPMGFAFAAVNMQRDIQKTFLEVNALDPKKDREKLEQLVSMRGIDRMLAQRQVKFAVPKGLLIGEGRERLFYRPEHLGEDAPAHCVPRMHVRGEVNAATVKRLLQPGTKLMEPKGKHELDLLYGEARQTFLEVEPCGKEHVAYAVEVTHKGEDGRDLGGLLCIFVPAHDYF